MKCYLPYNRKIEIYNIVNPAPDFKADDEKAISTDNIFDKENFSYRFMIAQCNRKNIDIIAENKQYEREYKLNRILKNNE